MTLLELELSPVKSDDLNQILELDQLCLGGLWTLEGYQKELDSSCTTFKCIINIKENNILGFSAFWKILEEAHITVLAVHPNYQNQGLGQLLLYALLHEAWKQKLERATLEVRQANQIALHIYQKFGFRIAGSRKGYYQKTGEDALILWRGDLATEAFAEILSNWRQQINERLAENNWILVNQRTS